MRHALRVFPAALSLLLWLGCSGGDGSVPDGSARAGARPSGAPRSSKPASTASATPTGSVSATAPTGALGHGVVHGVVSFTGKPPEMKTPAKRVGSGCPDDGALHNAVLVNAGKLRDVYVRVVSPDLKGTYAAEGAVEIDQKNCQFLPRVQGGVVGQALRVSNGDPVIHNVNARGGLGGLNVAQPKDARPVERKIEELGLVKLHCDMHPWMRAFVFAESHPFFAVSGEDGSYRIERLPPGKYQVEAWHSQFGWKKAVEAVEIAGETSATVDFAYSDKDPEPQENPGELKDLF